MNKQQALNALSAYAADFKSGIISNEIIAKILLVLSDGDRDMANAAMFSWTFEEDNYSYFE